MPSSLLPYQVARFFLRMEDIHRIQCCNSWARSGEKLVSRVLLGRGRTLRRAKAAQTQADSRVFWQVSAMHGGDGDLSGS